MKAHENNEYYPYYIKYFFGKSDLHLIKDFLFRIHTKFVNLPFLNYIISNEDFI